MKEISRGILLDHGADEEMIERILGYQYADYRKRFPENNIVVWIIWERGEVRYSADETGKANGDYQMNLAFTNTNSPELFTEITLELMKVD